ncbi:MAG TPA: hypothetical protein PK903_01100 [Paludibacteraceae bacterium]|nr:hypothetical protein [Paludibacteraceae bacterium]HOH54684.1 hypothetical protein [Paludibacteraceae bacterium]
MTMMKILFISSWNELFSGSVAGIIVVVSLIVLVILIHMIQSFVKKNSKSKVLVSEEIADNKNIPAEEIAAIAMALHLYLDSAHDEESNVLTIKRIERRYSPWNSKIYGLNNLHR